MAAGFQWRRGEERPLGLPRSENREVDASMPKTGHMTIHGYIGLRGLGWCFLSLLLLSLAIIVLLEPPPAEAANDTDLPNRPHDLGDMYLVEDDGSWFCPGDHEPKKICPGESDGPGGHTDDEQTTQFDSVDAVSSLLNYMGTAGPAEQPRVLRVGKARDKCENGDVGIDCPTAVPPPTACPDLSTPFCSLLALKAEGVGLGVILSSATDPENPRSTADMAWHACRIKIEDQMSPTSEEGLYDFIFIDLARQLGGRVDDVVERITNGQIYDSGEWTACPTPEPEWDVITNDNGYDTTPNYTLDTLAWGHARHLSVMSTSAKAIAAADHTAPAIKNEDLQFINAVQAVDSGTSVDTRAILRFEVTQQTSNFSLWLGRERRCGLLRWLATQQTTVDPKYTLLSPLYIHGQEDAGERSYDSFHRGTFTRQMELFREFQMPDSSSPALSPCPT